MSVELVVAMAENRVIGRNMALPWYIPEDLKFFKSITMGKPMIMGRKTFQSIGRPLPGRDNIVLTRSTDFKAEGVVVVQSFADALKEAERLAAARHTEAIMVIGGAQLFAESLPTADMLHLTKIHAHYEGDVFFPDIDERQWAMVDNIHHDATDDHPAYSFIRMERIRQS